MNDAYLRPFEQGRSFASQFTARRMNDIQRAIPKIRFSGTGIRVSNIAGQTFVQIAKTKPSPNAATHPLTVYDASENADSKIRVTPGIIIDSTNAFISWIPTINGNPINVQIGTPLAYPSLTVGASDIWIYTKSTIDNTTGFITAIEINSGTTIPLSTTTKWYLPLSTISVIITGGKASVKCNNDSVSGSQIFAYCGPLPLINGNFYQNGLI